MARVNRNKYVKQPIKMIAYKPMVENYSLPTGSISMSQVNVEIQKASGAGISLNEAKVRKLAGKTSGAISMNDLRGKRASFAKIRFKSNSWNTKNNYGTSDIGIYNVAGTRVHGWTANPVVGTWSDVTYDLPEGIYDIGHINFRRYIDTSSDGGASMEVWVYTSYNDTWTKIITDNSYRTGNGWETKTINHTDVYSI